MQPLRSVFFPEFMRSVSRLAAVGWSLSVWAGGCGAIAAAALLSTPQIAHAYTARVTLFVTRNPEESYDTFLRQSEAIARAGIQRAFDEDILTSEVVVIVIGENQGLAIPVMEVEVTRSEWQYQPDPQFWARYFDNAPSLLDL